MAEDGKREEISNAVLKARIRKGIVKMGGNARDPDVRKRKHTCGKVNEGKDNSPSEVISAISGRAKSSWVKKLPVVSSIANFRDGFWSTCFLGEPRT